MSVLEELHKSSIRVSDICAQYWCERQMELNYKHPPEITKEIKKGRQIHDELEGEVNVPIILQPKTYQDALYKGLYTSYMAVEALKKNGKAREIQIYGSFGGYKITGKVDELRMKEGEVEIFEDKTRADHKIPSRAQALTHKVQVLVYRRMMEDISKGEYTAKNFIVAYRTTNMVMSPEFVRQLDALGIEKELQTINAIAERFFSVMRTLNKIGETLYIRYLNQATGMEISLEKFKYDREEVQGIITHVLKYWSGQREALPVPEGEKWKCNFCVFFGNRCKVWWQQEAL